jgi:hypothetical protein
MSYLDYKCPEAPETFESVKTERDLLRQWLSELKAYQADSVNLQAQINDLRQLVIAFRP